MGNKNKNYNKSNHNQNRKYNSQKTHNIQNIQKQQILQHL